ncbi:MAG TPA: hypothetical protein G4N96_07155 [Chloroflexi bacterium]|nr:hypothetical protein [Chloroflexota bacterium]
MPSATLPPSSNKSEEFAQRISNLITPFTSGIFMAAFFIFKVFNSPFEALKWFSVTAVLTTAPPIACIVYLVKTGQLTDIHMPKRKERLKPLLFTFGWLIISIIALAIFKAPSSLILLTGVALLQVLVLGLITTLWKISFHSSAIMSAATVTVLFHSQWAFIALPLVPLVGWARIKLRRHTLWQVISGYIAGIAVALSAVYLIERYFPATLGG